MTKHTPGPWRVDPEYPTDVQTADGRLELCTPFSESMRGMHLAPPKVLVPNDEALANARLIAAAPDLIAALEDIVRHIHMDIGMQRRAQVAIDAAYGREPTGCDK